MARPTRHNADYFYHPADLRNDRRVGAIRARLGLAGYGLLVMLLEVLTDADHNRLDTDEVELELLAGDLHIETAELTGLIALAEKVRLFARTTDNLLHCPLLDEWLAPVYEKRDRVKLAQQSRRGGIPAAGNGNNPQPAETTPVVSETTGVVSETTLPVENSREQYSREDSSESSSAQPTPFAGEGAGEAQKKIGAENPPAAPLPTQPIASHTEGAAADVATAVSPGLPEWQRQGHYRDFDGPWPAQLRAPFGTPAFLAAWAKWGKYLSEINKRIGGNISEQEHLDRLSTLAGGDQAKALKIIADSITGKYHKLYFDETRPRTPAPGQRAFPASAAQQRRDVAPAGSQRSAA